MWSRWLSFVQGAWRQMPVETVVVAAAAAGAIGLSHDASQVWFARLVLGALIATPLAFAAHRLDRSGRRASRAAGGLAAAGAFAAVSAGMPKVDALFDDPSFAWPYLLALIAALLVPFLVPGPPFARFVRRFFEQTTTWTILCVCAVAALNVVALALAELFDLGIHRLAVDASIVLGCGFVLLYLHRLRGDDAAGGARMPELWRRLATMIGAPFVSIMLAILVIYEIVARLRGELPRNVLSPLIMAAGFVGLLSTLIISSVLEEAGGTAALAPADPHRWARRWSVRLTRAFPVILLALLPMAGGALWSRIDQHGITPFRAVRGMGLLCLASLSLFGTLRWLRGRAALSWEVPAAVLVFALTAAFGPLSAVQLSIRSQSDRVTRLLAEAGAGRTVAVDPAPVRFELDPDRYDELRDALGSLATLGGEPAVRRVLTGSVEACLSPHASSCLEHLGVYRRGSETTRRQSALVTLEAHGRFPTAMGEVELIELIRHVDDPVPAPASTASSTLGAEFVLEADRVVLHVGGLAVAHARLAALIEQPHINVGLPAWTQPLVRPDGRVVAELAVERLDVEQPDGGVPQAVRLTGIVLWRPRSEPRSEQDAPATLPPSR